LLAKKRATYSVKRKYAGGSFRFAQWTLRVAGFSASGGFEDFCTVLLSPLPVLLFEKLSHQEFETFFPFFAKSGIIQK
jgi:hypothetical protein